MAPADPSAPVSCLRRGALGDTLLMVPVLRALRRAYPSSPLHFAGVGEYGALLQRYRVVDHSTSTESLALWRLADLRQRFAAYRLVLCDDAAVSAAIGAPRARAFDPRLERGDRRPAAQQLLDRCGLHGPADVVLAARDPRAGTGPAVLHPGAGSPRKRAPLPRWRQLAAALVADGRAVTVVLGDADLEREPTACDGWPSRATVRTGLDVAALADLLAGAVCYCGHDSGPTHLAAALSVPTLAVFVDTDPLVWAPAAATVVHGLDVDVVRTWIARG